MIYYNMICVDGIVIISYVLSSRSNKVVIYG